MIHEEKTVPCSVCSQATPFTGTKLCNNCWEVKGRIEKFISNDNGLLFIIRKVKEAKIKNWQKVWYNELHNIDNEDGSINVKFATEIINSIKCDTNKKEWKEEMMNYSANSLCMGIIADALSNQFLWLEIEE